MQQVGLAARVVRSDTTAQISRDGTMQGYARWAAPEAGNARRDGWTESRMDWVVSGDARAACVGRVGNATPARGARPSTTDELRQGFGKAWLKEKKFGETGGAWGTAGRNEQRIL